MKCFLILNLIKSVTFKLLHLHASDIFSFFKVWYIPTLYNVTHQFVSVQLKQKI